MADAGIGPYIFDCGKDFRNDSAGDCRAGLLHNVEVDFCQVALGWCS